MLFCVRELNKTELVTAVQRAFHLRLNILAVVFKNLGHSLSNVM
jgi:hypothetical protein